MLTHGKDKRRLQANSVASLERTTKKPKKISIFWIIGISASLMLGIVSGYALFEVFKSGEIGNYDGINASRYAVDYSALASRYQPNKSDYTKDYTPCEMANLSLYSFWKKENWQMEGKGTQTFNVFGVTGEQTTVSMYGRSKDEYFEESLSKSSFVQEAWRSYGKYNGNEDAVVKRYKGRLGSNVYESTFREEDVKVYSREEYKNHCGRYLDGIPSVYLISDKCLASAKEEPKSGKKTEVVRKDGGYLVELELNPRIAVKYYVNQMMATSDLAGPPSFNFVHLSFELDYNLNIIAMSSYESFYAKTAKGAGSNLVANYKTNFYADKDFKIPGLNERSSYTR